MGKGNSGGSAGIPGRYVAYYRVGTKRQGESGLGLEAQQAAVRDYLTGRGWPPVAEFVEVESGRNNERVELAHALHACRLYKATLIIAKLDRLARNVAFVSSLMESGVEFCAVDFPQANRLTVHILAAVAEHEREMISQRTVSALAAAKARGRKLGGFRGHVPSEADRMAAATAVRTKADAHAEKLREIVMQVRGEGIASAAGLARVLNARGVPTPRDREWQAVQARRLMARLGL